MSRTMLTNEPSGARFAWATIAPHPNPTTTLPDGWTPDGYGHEDHQRMRMEKLVGVCKPCARRKLAWMDRQPRSGHVYRAAVRFHLLYDEVLR